ncbi:MAG: acetylglutamate kinase [Pseudomonadales bacterium]
MSEYSKQSSAEKPLAVLKVGGDIIADTAQRTGLANNIQQLVSHGWNAIVLHGGGPQVSQQQAKLGIESRKVGGRRITSKEDLQLVKQVICGELNVDLVTHLQAAGVNAFGCHGASGQLITAAKRAPTVVSGGGAEPIDFGEVGDVTGINAVLLQHLLAADTVPVIASLGCNASGEVFNINADTTVVQIARAMSADLLVLVSAVGAIFENIDDPSTRIGSINRALATQHIKNGAISAGMIPKVEEALTLAEETETQVVIANMLEPDTLLSISAGKNKIGTRIASS